MKLIMESWRKFLNEAEEEPQTKPKAIFMAGGPGSGKSTVLRGLDLGISNILNADKKYEADLESAGLSLGGKPQVYTRIKELQAELEVDPDNKEAEEELVAEKGKMSQYAKIFNAAQAQKKADYKQFTEPSEGEPQSFIVDGTAGQYSVMAKEKSNLEKQGYDVAMVYVDLDMETAIERNRARGQPDPKTGKAGRQLLDREVKSSHAAVKKNKEAYEGLFGENFFYVNAGNDTIKSDTTTIKPGVEAFISAESLEENDYPLGAPNINKQLKRVLRHGGNKTKAKPYGKKARIDYRGSAPPGAGGS